MCALCACMCGHRENTEGGGPRLLSAGLLQREASIKLKEPGKETVFVPAAAQTLFFIFPAPRHCLAQSRHSINICWLTKTITSSLIPFPEVRGNCVSSGELKIVFFFKLTFARCYAKCHVHIVSFNSQDREKYFSILHMGMLDAMAREPYLITAGAWVWVQVDWLWRLQF